MSDVELLFSLAQWEEIAQHLLDRDPLSQTGHMLLDWVEREKTLNSSPLADAPRAVKLSQESARTITDAAVSAQTRR